MVIVVITKLVWVASISMWFQSKERQRNGKKWDFLVLAAPKMEQVVFDLSFSFFAV